MQHDHDTKQGEENTDNTQMRNTTQNGATHKQEQNNDKNNEQHADENIDGNKTVQRSTSQHKIPYTEYLHNENHDSEKEVTCFDESI